MTRLTLSLLLLTGGVVAAAVAPGENLLINGAFEAEQLNFPVFWEKGGSTTGFDPTGGPGNTGALVFGNSEGLAGISSSCRQHDQQIVAGETYKMSAYVKTVGFKSRHCGIIVHNNGWYTEGGIKSFPENTDGWQYVEQEFVLSESKDNVYGVAIFAIDYVGEIRFAQVKLEAISDGKSCRCSALSSTSKVGRSPRQRAMGGNWSRVSLTSRPSNCAKRASSSVLSRTGCSSNQWAPPPNCGPTNARAWRAKRRSGRDRPAPLMSPG